MNRSRGPVASAHHLLFGLVLTVAAFGFGSTGTAEEPATAESSAGIRLRNIVRRSLPADAEVIGLVFTVLKVNKDGDHLIVNPADHSFTIGDSFLIKIRPLDDVYVYIFTEGPQTDAGRHRACLLPKTPDAPLRVRAGEEIHLPDDGDLFTFEPPAGEEKLVVIALKDANPDLNLLASAAFKRGGTRLQSEQEQAAKEKASEAIDDVRKRGNEAIRFKGSPRVLEQKIAEAKNGKKTEIVPDWQRGIGGAKIGINASELIIDIPLKSRPAAADGN